LSQDHWKGRRACGARLLPDLGGMSPDLRQSVTFSRFLVSVSVSVSVSPFLPFRVVVEARGEEVASDIRDLLVDCVETILHDSHKALPFGSALTKQHQCSQLPSADCDIFQRSCREKVSFINENTPRAPTGPKNTRKPARLASNSHRGTNKLKTRKMDSRSAEAQPIPAYMRLSVDCLFLRSPSRVLYRTELIPRAPKGRRTRTPHP